MLQVCFNAGLRASELVGLRVDDVNFVPRPSIRVLGKGRRERQLPLWKETGAALRAWLAIRGEATVPEVFLNAVGEAMTRGGFDCVLKRHVATAATSCPSLSTKRVFPHILRHTCALVMLKATKDIRKVALWLGHNSIQTTEMYVRADPTEKLEAVSAITPPSLRKGRFHAPDQLIEMLSGRTKADDYAEKKKTEGSWTGPRRRLTVHNQ